MHIILPECYTASISVKSALSKNELKSSIENLISAKKITCYNNRTTWTSVFSFGQSASYPKLVKYIKKLATWEDSQYYPNLICTLDGLCINIQFADNGTFRSLKISGFRYKQLSTAYLIASLLNATSDANNGISAVVDFMNFSNPKNTLSNEEIILQRD